jgi:hypothetical protein
LQQVLDSILACPDHDEWTLVFSCEPNQSIFAMVEAINWIPRYASVNLINMRAGINTNTFLAASVAHSMGSEFNIYLEEDVVISRDALTMASQFYEKNIDGVLCFRRWANTERDQPDTVEPANHGLLGDGFAYPRGLWEKTIRPWWFWYEPTVPFGWDWSVGYGLDTRKVRQWRPLCQRSQNIGHFGTNTQGGADPNRFSPRYSGEPIKTFVFNAA